VAWCTVVVVAPAVVRRDGRVQAQGRPCEYARLGSAEVELDRLCGPSAIERIAAGVGLTGKIKGSARREMSVAFTIRAVLLMTLMPEADAREVFTTLLGDLTMVPWRRRHAVPSATVLSSWRAAIGPEPLQQLQEVVLAATAAEHRDPTLPAIEVGSRLRLGAIDGNRRACHVFRVSHGMANTVTLSQRKPSGEEDSQSIQSNFPTPRSGAGLTSPFLLEMFRNPR
jgi:hypothetical protein